MANQAEMSVRSTHPADDVAANLAALCGPACTVHGAGNNGGCKGGLAIVRVLREGGQGKVSLAINRSCGQLYALKEYKGGSVPAPRTLLSKLKLGDVAKRTIIHMVHASATIVPVLLMSYCPMGDLTSYMRDILVDCRRRGCTTIPKVPETFIWHVFRQLTDGLDFLHNGYGNPKEGLYPKKWRTILHRDIKTENILVMANQDRPNGLPLIKLADFDLADFYQTDVPERPFKGGTYSFQPPEQWAMYDRPVARPAGDVWAVGSVIHELCTGIIPRGISRYRYLPVALTAEDSEWNLVARARERVLTLIKISPQYSETLDVCLKQALSIKNRPNARELRRLVQRYTRDMTEEMAGYLMPPDLWPANYDLVAQAWAQPQCDAEGWPQDLPYGDAEQVPQANPWQDNVQRLPQGSPPRANEPEWPRRRIPRWAAGLPPGDEPTIFTI